MHLHLSEPGWTFWGWQAER